MKKDLGLVLSLTVIIAQGLLSGCNKMSMKSLPDAIVSCRIEKIILPAPLPDGNDTVTFAYNSSGNPISATHLPNHVIDGNNFVLDYDARQRLTGYRELYGNGIGGGFLHKYIYGGSSNDQILVDSNIRDYLLTNGVVTGADDTVITYYQYDPYGRISQAKTAFQGDTTVMTYAYDASGNLESPGVTYDNKVNIHRTNKVWMFIDRNYSANNPYKATGYNSVGLPLSINPTGDFSSSFADILVYNALVEYSCP